MKINKELRLNIFVFLAIIVFDITGDIVINGKKLSDVLSYPLWMMQITVSLSFFFVYYLNYTIATPHFLVKKKYWQYAVAFIVMIFLFAGFRFLLEEIILYNITGYHNYNMKNPYLLRTYLLDSMFYTFRYCLISTIVYLFVKNDENKEKIHQLNIQSQQAQLTTLKSQISPHFLFNTLNNFYVDLIDDKPETANDILKLSNLMRYVTYETSDDFVPLLKEIDFIKDYLHFYKRRYEDNLQIQFSVNGEVKNQQIPTLILIHFIENVCKHGIINDRNRPAKIGINISDTHLEILTENHINSSEKYMGKGIGTENIKKRLNVIFEDSYTLTNENKNSIFKSYLKIPIK